MQLSSWHFLVFYINFCLLSSLNELQSCNSQVNTVILRYHKPGYPYLINEMSHNLKEIETLLSDEINGLGDLAGSLGGAQKHTWRWNLKIFFHGINFYYKRGYFCEKRGWKSSKTKKFFFCTNTTCFYSVQWRDIHNSFVRWITPFLTIRQTGV